MVDTRIQIPVEDLSGLKLVHAMPKKLVMIRHGESQANLINRAIKNGIISEYPPGFAETPDREIRLSKNGVMQVEKTGPWLREQYPDGTRRPHRRIHKDHARAMETVSHLCLQAGWENVEIRVDPLLGERNWGRFVEQDLETRNAIMKNRLRGPLHNPMPDGETLLDTRLRSRELLDRCAREFTDKRVLVVSHGEFIEALWAEIAHMNTERQLEFFHSDAGDIKNCQVVEFSSVDPKTDENTGKLRWVRSSCPQAEIFREWVPIERIKYKPADLLEKVGRFPRLEFEDALAS